MHTVDWIGFTGVAVLLAAYFLNLRGVIAKDSLSYILLNIVGALIACVASVMLHYVPFVILELCWAMVSGVELYLYFKKA